MRDHTQHIGMPETGEFYTTQTKLATKLVTVNYRRLQRSTHRLHDSDSL